MLQVPAFARSGVDHAKGRHRSGDRENLERSRLASGRTFGSRPPPSLAWVYIAEGGAQRSLSSRRRHRLSFRVALPPCEAGGSGLRRNQARRFKSKAGRRCETHVSPSPEVMPHATSSFGRHHPLALRFAPHSSLSAENLLALAWDTRKVATAVATARMTPLTSSSRADCGTQRDRRGRRTRGDRPCGSNLQPYCR